MAPPPLTPQRSKASASLEAESPWLLSQTLSPAGILDTSLQDLHLADTPLASTARPLKATYGNAAHDRAISRPLKSRPSWGSAAIVDSQSSAKARGKMRFLQDLDDGADDHEAKVPKPPVAGVAPRAGAGRPRFSLFAKPGLPAAEPEAPRKDASTSNEIDPEDIGELDAVSTQTGKPAPAGATSTADSLASSSHIAHDEAEVDEDGGHDDTFLRDAILGKSSAHDGGSKSTAKESADSISRQLFELRRLNAMFTSYETMLRGSAGQLSTFASRISETDDLLNLYIEMLRHTEKTQKLLHDEEWRGATQDVEEAHRLQMELKERETRRVQKEAAAREEARIAALAAEEEERKRAEREREREEERRSAAADRGRGRGRGTTRGGSVARGASASARGTAAATSRGRGIARTTPPTGSTSSTATTRGVSAARGGSTALGRGRPVSTTSSTTTTGRTASASTGTRTTSSSSSGIPTRSSTSTSTSAGLGGQYANVKSSGYGPR